MLRSMADIYALILAGGSGTRFWPLSRNTKPKQLLNLFGNDTLLRLTIDRLSGLVPAENILILTNELQEKGVRDIAHEIPSHNIIAEPAKRDTAPAVALGIGLIAARDPLATMMVLPADQLIQDISSYQQIMSEALRAAQTHSALVTVGIKPTWACPSYGYIERGEIISENSSASTAPYKVVCFREKPNSELAETFLKRGNFAWNAGMFIWTIPTVIKELSTHAPELSQFVDKILASTNHDATIREVFPSLTATSIDYALMEHASEVLNLEATFDWDDVGSWISVAKYLETLADGNQTNTPLSSLESTHNIVFTSNKDTRVALLGVNDLIIVQTDDALLVANRHQADDIKKLIENIPKDMR